MSRDEHLLQIRPQLDLPPSDHSEVEHFHHRVLRPILKLQNDLLLAQYDAWMIEYKQSLTGLEPAQQLQKIEQACKTHKRLRAQAFGMITGMMTAKEYEFYLANRRELHKRITSMWSKRIFDGRTALTNV